MSFEKEKAELEAQVRRLESENRRLKAETVDRDSKMARLKRLEKVALALLRQRQLGPDKGHCDKIEKETDANNTSDGIRQPADGSPKPSR